VATVVVDYDSRMIAATRILVCSVFSNITPASFHVEQAFSSDGGATREVNWKATFTR
jgi:hypothetical protein